MKFLEKYALTDDHSFTYFIKSDRRELAPGLPKKDQRFYWCNLSYWGFYIPKLTHPEFRTFTYVGGGDIYIVIGRKHLTLSIW